MKYRITLNEKVYEVIVEDGEAILEKEYDAASVQTAPAAEHVAPAPTPQTALTGEGEAVRAPLPGTVVKILCKAGDKIRKGTPVVVIEAMKMENDVVSPQDGVVTAIPAAKGQSVEKDAPLFFIK